jgi:hypothetical protein
MRRPGKSNLRKERRKPRVSHARCGPSATSSSPVGDRTWGGKRSFPRLQTDTGPMFRNGPAALVSQASGFLGHADERADRLRAARQSEHFARCAALHRRRLDRRSTAERPPRAFEVAGRLPWREEVVVAVTGPQERLAEHRFFALRVSFAGELARLRGHRADHQRSGARRDSGPQAGGRITYVGLAGFGLGFGPGGLGTLGCFGVAGAGGARLVKVVAAASVAGAAWIAVVGVASRDGSLVAVVVTPFRRRSPRGAHRPPRRQVPRSPSASCAGSSVDHLSAVRHGSNPEVFHCARPR